MKNALKFLIVGINAYMLISYSMDIDTSDTDASIGFGFIALMVVLTIINIPLYILYRVIDRKAKRLCPACGVNVKVGLTICPMCKFDFAKSAGT
jgi:hypothetical protein